MKEIQQLMQLNLHEYRIHHAACMKFHLDQHCTKLSLECIALFFKKKNMLQSHKMMHYLLISVGALCYVNNVGWDIRTYKTMHYF